MGIANDKEYEFLDNSQQDEYNIVLKAIEILLKQKLSHIFW